MAIVNILTSKSKNPKLTSKMSVACNALIFQLGRYLSTYSACADLLSDLSLNFSLNQLFVGVMQVVSLTQFVNVKSRPVTFNFQMRPSVNLNPREAHMHASFSIPLE